MHFLSLAPQMFFASLAEAAPAPQSADQILDHLQHLTQAKPAMAGLWLLGGLLATILSYWLASLAVAKDEGSFINALKVFGFYILVLLGGAAIFGIVGYILLSANQHSAILPAAIGGAVLFFVAIFAVPMKIYEIGFLRALGFLILSWIIKMAFTVGLMFVPGNPASEYRVAIQQYVALDPQERAKFVELLQKRLPMTAAQRAAGTVSGEVVAADKSKSFRERQEALQVMYDELEQHRRALKTGDVAAIAKYNREKTRYQELLTQLKADVAANPPQNPAPR